MALWRITMQEHRPETAIHIGYDADVMPMSVAHRDYIKLAESPQVRRLPAGEALPQRSRVARLPDGQRRHVQPALLAQYKPNKPKAVRTVRREAAAHVRYTKVL